MGIPRGVGRQWTVGVFAAAAFMAAAGPAIPGALAQPVITETFTTPGNPGWTVFNDGINLRHDANAGNPGGCLRADDGSGGSYWGFNAGPLFLGNRSCSYGGLLSWDFFTTQASAAAGPTIPDLTIEGGGLVLVIDLPLPAINTWISRQVELTEAAGWRKSTLTGAVPTLAEFRAVLANVTAIRFRAEFSTSVDAARIDNVQISAFSPSAPAPVTLCSGGPAQFTVTVTTAPGGGSIQFAYRWRRNGVFIDPAVNPSAETNILSFAATTPADTGSYDCVVTRLDGTGDTCGTITTTAALLDVRTCPCNPADIALADGSPGPDGFVNNGDFQLFFANFFNATCPACGALPPPIKCNPADIAQSDATPGFDGCVDNGDFQCFFSQFFGGCP